MIEKRITKICSSKAQSGRFRWVKTHAVWAAILRFVEKLG
jgi:hypothetical protein